MGTMTRRERLTAIFRGRTPDRPAVKLWSAAPGQTCADPAFEPVRDLAVRLTDLVVGGGASFHLYCGRHAEKLIEDRTVPTASPDWEEAITVLHTPAGDLRQVFVKSTRKRPGHVREHFLKDPADIRKLLSIR